MYRNLRLLICLTGLALVLVACAGQTPQPIAVAPRSQPPSGPVPLASYPASAPLPPAASVVYDAYLELETGDVRKTAERAAALAERYGGYLSDSQTWLEQDQLHASLTLLVPAPNFSDLRQELLALGNLQTEQVSGRWSSSYERDWLVYSRISLRLAPAAALIRLPEWPQTGWNPGRTAAQAFQVFLTIFGFLADVFIWLLIVVGPFLLLLVLARQILRWLRRP